MQEKTLKLVHLAAWIRGRGGVETLLERHRAGDARHGLSSTEMALFDGPSRKAADRQYTPASPEDALTPYSTQQFSWRTTPRGMRRSLARALEPHAAGLVVYHNAWGLPWFADRDGAKRRIAYLHTNENDFGPWLPALAPLVDGVVCVNPLAADAARRLLPALAAERFLTVRLPIETPPPAASDSRPPRREWVIGCAGRQVRAQKRSERIVPFVGELKRLGVPFRMEILGDGPLRPWLQRRLAAEPAVRFFGWAGKEEFWRRLQSWDVAAFFCDMEGGPILLAEAMAAGALPVYPAIGGTLGDAYAPKIDRSCLYPAGNVKAAAAAVRELLTQPPQRIDEKRLLARELARAHEEADYVADFAAFAHRIAALPRRSREARGQRSTRWVDWLPLGVVTRACPQELWR
jgi:glycosyltransferase involved in cell wall biosynthesis